MKRLGDWLVYFAVRIVVCVVQSLPIETCAWWTRLLALVATRVIPIRREVIDENLRQAFPQLSTAQRRAMTRQMWEHLLLMFCEIAQVRRRIHETNWRDHVRMHRLREFCQLLLAPRPNVVLLGHFGNFEVAGYVAGLLGLPTYTVARPLDNPYLDQFVSRFRRTTGQYILPKHGSAEAVQTVLEQGGTLALLGDQHAGRKGCWVNFFGRPASCHKAIALFSLTTRAPMMVMYAKRLDRPLQFEMGMLDYIDLETADPALANVQALTEWYNGQLERMVRDAPQQYWWVHRRWKGSPPPVLLRRMATVAQAKKPAA